MYTFLKIILVYFVVIMTSDVEGGGGAPIVLG